MHKSKVQDVMACRNDGFTCSQAILSAYCEEFGLDKNIALKLACGLGAGMGKLQETCGAVSGAYLVISLKHGQLLKEDKPAKEKTYDLVREFARLFEERNKTTSCRELLGIDLMSSSRETIRERVKVVCPKLVQDAAEIVEIILYSDEE